MNAEFAAALLDPACPVPGGLRAPGGVAERFAIHRNNVAVAWIEALRQTYPATCALLGAEMFNPLALAYARGHAPGSPVLARWGGGFAGWLARRLPRAAELAWLEWLRVRAWAAADAGPLAPEAIAALLAHPERLEHTRLRLHPSVDTVRAAAPIVGWWSAAMRGELPDAADTGVESALVLRDPGDDVLVIGVDAGTAEFIDALKSRAPLAHAAAAGGDPAGAFELLIRHGAIVGWECDREDMENPS